MTTNRKQRIHDLLKGIETGDPAAVEVINPDKYIQHNPQTHEGRDGLAALFKRLAATSPRVNLVRVFEDGDYVFAHTEYFFSSARVGFEVFRFEGDMTVEHWDNIQSRQGPNAAGRSMVDGPTTATDMDHTEPNRALVRAFVDDVLVHRRIDAIDRYIDESRFTEHNPRMHGLPELLAALAGPASDASLRYDCNHRLLAEGSFVLSVSEGERNGAHNSFYDLFRLADGRIVEHWDTSETIPPRSEWKNDNGKF